jgi:hypothetical protein
MESIQKKEQEKKQLQLIKEEEKLQIYDEDEYEVDLQEDQQAKSSENQ